MTQNSSVPWNLFFQQHGHQKRVRGQTFKHEADTRNALSRGAEGKGTAASRVVGTALAAWHAFPCQAPGALDIPTRKTTDPGHREPEGEGPV